MENKEKHKILPLYAVARKLHVPQKWLRAEAEANRIPHLKAGKSILLNPDIVEKILVERASGREMNTATETIQPALHRNNRLHKKEIENVSAKKRNRANGPRAESPNEIIQKSFTQGKS